MKKAIFAVFVMVIGINARGAEINEAKTGVVGANVTEMKLDPKLPEPFSRTKYAQVAVNFNDKTTTLLFIMSDSEGIEVTFPIISDQPNNCGDREITAVPPSDSTPYYRDFEIKVTDYSGHTCDSPIPAKTYATLRSYEVGTHTKTLSVLLAEELKPVQH